MDREDKNINAAVRVSQVHNVDEEKLVFKAVVGIAAANGQAGQYKFNLPPLTDICNSNEYQQAVIKLDQITISPFSALINNVAFNNSRPLWTDRFTGPGAPAPPLNNSSEAFSALLLMMRLPSRQTGHATTNINNINQRSVLYYRYTELIPCFWTWRGNYQGIQPINAIQGGGPGAVAGNSFAITHQPNHEGILCANPFGSEIEFNFKNPGDIAEDQVNMYLADNADMNIPRDDITEINLQLTITLVPNKK